MSSPTPERMRSVAVLGHSHDGKTTLCEALLDVAGATSRLGSTDQGTSILDFEPEEQRRSISITTAIAHCDWNGVRINLLDTVATEVAAPWTETPAINPGPFQFHPDDAHVRTWMAARGYLFCRKGRVREIMRPIAIPAADGMEVRWGLCDGIHRDDHELIPA